MRRNFEFALVVIIVSILVVVVMQALERARVSTEEATMQMEVTAIRAQLMEVAVHREAFGGKLPDSTNPMDWISNLPANYRGASDAPPDERGGWYFDSRAGELNYLFHDGRSARFRLSREPGRTDGRGMPAGVGLLRLDDKMQ